MFQSRIEVIKDNERVDGKSILAILMLAAVAGTELRLEATGPDAEAALDSLAELVSQTSTKTKYRFTSFGRDG